MWILYTAIYGILIGFFTVFRKKATEKTNILFVLALSSTIGFLLMSWSGGEAFLLSWQNILSIFGKSFIIALAWVFELLALRNYHISFLQPISAIKIIVAFIASLLIFNEPVIWWKFFGVAIIFVSLILLNQFDKKMLRKQSLLLKKNKYANVIKNPVKYQKFYTKADDGNSIYHSRSISAQHDFSKRRIKAIIYFVISCLLSATSAILDKIIISNVSTNQMQFWFMLFVSVIIWLFFFAFCIKEKKMLVCKSDWKNWVMYILPVLLIVSDRFLFTALSQPDVLVSGVEIIKQLSTVVAVIFGGLLYKEPKLPFKLIFLAFILIGIVIAII